MSPFDRVRAALANVVAFQNGSEDALAAFAEIERELERERMRLAACGVVAMCDTPESASQARDMHPEYFSASCGDVGSVGGGEMRAPTVATVGHHYADTYRIFGTPPPVGTELIARPTRKDGE